MRISPVIFGCKGTSLTSAEKAFYTRVQPWGFILFGRNVETPDQVAALVEELKSCVEQDDVAILIDQEGGRVRRLRPPHWAEYHSGEIIGGHFRADSERGKRIAWLQSRLMAIDLISLGINVDCLPVLDVPIEGSHDVIGDRAYGYDAETVSTLGRVASEGLLAGGVLPVIKHIPGHGRALVDSHKDLPRVDTTLEELERTDFVSFRKLGEMPVAMTAHVVYSDIDPDAPATTSRTVVQEIIRDSIGFEGLLMCDDLSMHALSGDFAQRTQSSFAAGCDVVLHCNGEMEEMKAVAAALPEFTSQAWERAQKAASYWHHIQPADEAELRQEFAELCQSSDYEFDPTEAAL